MTLRSESTSDNADQARPRHGGAGNIPGAHAVELTVWDVPPAVAASERFVVSVGAGCSAGCNLGGREVAILDPRSSLLTTAKLGDNVWPGTKALFFATVDMTAPVDAGSYHWEARVDAWQAESLHLSGSYPAVVRVVPLPECEVTVTVTDQQTQAPLAGARVVMHPYRAMSDDHGIARLRVSKGQFDILVSTSKYLPTCLSVEVSGDMAVDAVLEGDRTRTNPDEYPE